jgi:hypothetical protein
MGRNPWFETVAEAQRRARKRLPSTVYGALVAGSERGRTIDDNTAAFSRLGFAPRVVGHHAQLAPDRVRLEAAVVGDTRPLAVLLPELMAHGVRAVSPSGVLGDPTGASAAEGHRTLDTMVAAAVRRITAWTVDDRGRLAEPVSGESAHQVARP